MPPRLDLTGQRFGKLLVIKRAKNKGKGKRKRAAWLCKCDCGKEKIIARDSLRSGKTRSCGCLHSPKNNPKVKMAFAKLRKGFGEADFNCLYGDYKYSAKARKLEFLLTKEQFLNLVTKNCAYCGVSPNQIQNNRSTHGFFIYNGIDRINNKKGYIIENCVPCCKFCNYAKKRGTQEEFLNWIERLKTLGR